MPSIYDAYSQAVEPDFAYQIAHTLSTDARFHSSQLGTRTAGSAAEHAAAAYLAQTMEAMGLADVQQVPVSVTRWEFRDATLTLPDGTRIKPHSYATAATPEEGIAAEIICLGKGTMQDYAGQDVAGKIVLIDIDQRADWWITYPMLEAQLHGAAAILSASAGGLSQVNDRALNAQDICGPVGIPCVSISVRDAKHIRALLAQGPVRATLCVDNAVEPGGTSYNVIGRIRGRTSDEMILVGAHYDMFFQGFQDDSCGIGLVLAMAKAMLASGYTPQRDIVFCLHGAEEWGATRSSFDWQVGAWRMINEACPQWSDKVLAFLNFELPAYAFADYTYVTSSPELYTLLHAFVHGSGVAPVPEGCFPAGVLTEGYPSYPYSDDFSYHVAGVPSMVNGFLHTADQQDVYPFYYERYHSQFDDASTYDEAVMQFNLRFYGALALYIDQSPVLRLDFSAQCDRLREAYDARWFAYTGADSDGYLAAIETVCKSAARASAAQPTDARAHNAALLKAFRYAQDTLVALMYERPVVPHDAQLRNLAQIQAVLDAIEQGEAPQAAVINNGLEWYNQHFSAETIATVNGMLQGEGSEQFWGTDKMFPLAQVEAATRSLTAKHGDASADYAPEIEIYTDALREQAARMAANIAREIDSIHKLAGMLDALR